MTFLRQAQARGWHQARSARLEPYLHSLRNRADFGQLLAAADRELEADAAAYAVARN
jgi:hypothetical protein